MTETPVPDQQASTPPASFEAAMTELTEIVQSLEEGTISLEDSIKAYERGMFLKSFCEMQLKQAKLRIDQVVKQADGSVSLEPSPLQNETDL